MPFSLGRFGEAWAVAYLAKHGYQIVARNVRYRSGELDIIAREGSELVFVEVKCRRSSRFGAPEASIDRRRYSHLESAIQEYLAAHALEPPSYRIDVVAIEINAQGKVTRCDVLRAVEPPAD